MSDRMLYETTLLTHPPKGLEALRAHGVFGQAGRKYTPIELMVEIPVLLGTATLATG